MTRSESTRALNMAARHSVAATRHRFGNRGEWAVEFQMDRTTYDLAATKRHIAQLSSGTMARATQDQTRRTARIESRGWKLVSQAKIELGLRTWDEYGIDLSAGGR